MKRSNGIHDRVGVAVFPWGKERPSIDTIVRIAKHAEDLGFDSIHMPWHFTLPDATFPWGNRYVLDPLVVAPILIRETKRIKFSFNAGVLPILHPFFWAQYLASLDVASGGRTIPAVALGWWEEDFSVGLTPMRERGRRFDEALDILTRLWRGDEILQAGTFWDCRSLHLDPKPRPAIPLWIGGDIKSIERAARWGTALNPLDPTLDHIRNVLRPGLDDAGERNGHRIDLAGYCQSLVVLDSDDQNAVNGHYLPFLEQRVGRALDDSVVYGSPQQCAKHMANLLGAGLDYFVFDCYFHGWETEQWGMEQMSRLANDVLPLIREPIGPPVQ
jgi:alkanesulfonate monooxygenase SsuD/methylene tetrahydromethanopterin reductase-like flavin-dependent oxidoreductase (luciferase family)